MNYILGPEYRLLKATEQRLGDNGIEILHNKVSFHVNGVIISHTSQSCIWQIYIRKHVFLALWLNLTHTNFLMRLPILRMQFWTNP